MRFSLVSVRKGATLCETVVGSAEEEIASELYEAPARSPIELDHFLSRQDGTGSRLIVSIVQPELRKRNPDAP